MTLTAPPQQVLTEVAATTVKPGRPRRRRPSDNTRTLISAVDLNRHRVAYFVAVTVTLLLFTAAFLFPLYWMVDQRAEDPGRVRPAARPPSSRESLHPETYCDAWTNMRIGKFFLNTVYYALGGWLIQLVVDVAAAYALSKLRPIFGKLILGAMLASLMLPAAALLVPAYLTVADVPIFGWNLLNTPWALWLPAAANAFNVYVLKRFFDQIPNDLLDAAAIDGAGPAAGALVDRAAAVPAGPRGGLDLRDHRDLEGLPLAAAGAAGHREADPERRAEPARQHQSGAADGVHGRAGHRQRTHDRHLPDLPAQHHRRTFRGLDEGLEAAPHTAISADRSDFCALLRSSRYSESR